MTFNCSFNPLKKSLLSRNPAPDGQVGISLKPKGPYQVMINGQQRVLPTSCFLISSDVGFPSCYEKGQISYIRGPSMDGRPFVDYRTSGSWV
jgi:hypothetical protein